MSDCYYSCMDGCGKGGGKPVQCEQECSGSCVSNPAAAATVVAVQGSGYSTYGIVPTVAQAVHDSRPVSGVIPHQFAWGPWNGQRSYS